MKRSLVKIVVGLLPILFWGCGDSGTDEISFAPIYLNETNAEVFIVFSEKRLYADSFEDTIKVSARDSAYQVCGEHFPLLQEKGLRSTEEDSLTDVRVVFYPNTDSAVCLNFFGEKILQNDIRNFSEYKTIGYCDFCSVCGDRPEGMLYRITDDLLERAEPCE